MNAETIDELEIPLEEMTDAWIEGGNYSQQTVADLRDVLTCELQRSALFERCLDRALKLWQAAHPEAHFWPDGAKNLAWVFDRLSIIENFDIEDYIQSLHWTPDATDYEITLVAGNLRGLYFKLTNADTTAPEMSPVETVTK